MSQTISGQPHDRFALILYGSETGNSHDVAGRLGQITERLHFKTIVTEMDDFAEVVEKKMKSGEVVSTLSVAIYQSGMQAYNDDRRKSQHSKSMSCARRLY